MSLYLPICVLNQCGCRWVLLIVALTTNASSLTKILFQMEIKSPNRNKLFVNHQEDLVQAYFTKQLFVFIPLIQYQSFQFPKLIWKPRTRLCWLWSIHWRLWSFRMVFRSPSSHPLNPQLHSRTKSIHTGLTANSNNLDI